MLSDLTTGFIGRLRARDPQAWFELWETFGPILRSQLAKWGGGRIGAETVQDLSQETLAALADAIDRHDPDRGARFSTWLLAIAKHSLYGEIDRRMAQKRGAGRPAAELDEELHGATAAPDAPYETAVFHAKVEAALRLVERESEFVEFSVYRMRVLDGRTGREVAEALGISEPTVSRLSRPGSVEAGRSAPSPAASTASCEAPETISRYFSDMTLMCSAWAGSNRAMSSQKSAACSRSSSMTCWRMALASSLSVASTCAA